MINDETYLRVNLPVHEAINQDRKEKLLGGARIFGVTPRGNHIWREIHGGSGYLSMDPKVQHIGLGSEESIDLTIVWPDGDRQQVKALEADRAYEIHQGEKAVVSSR